VFSQGSITFLNPANHRVLAYIREYGKDQVLVANNLAGTVQFVELDLRALEGSIPIEMFGNSLFPRIGELPYLLTMGPYEFYWFKLRRL
jgi:maltose alpha-D-glucosyltransferase/alpha-amylase